MIIISGSEKKFKKFLDYLVKDCEYLGYEMILNDYEKYKFDNKHEIDVYKAKIPMKPEIILDSIKGKTGKFAYMDCDVRIKERVSFNGDIAITTREPRYQDGKILNHAYPHITGYLNAGVIFLKATDKVRAFIKEWIKEIPYTQTGSDQEALTNLLRRHITDWSYGIKDVMGLKIELLPINIYNCKTGDKEAKIFHFAGTYEEKCAVYSDTKQKEIMGR
jgi:hypothetical protein